MTKGDYLTAILRSPKTVFTAKDMALLWHDPGSPAARVRMHYYTKNNDLYRIRKGLYAKSPDYNHLELATRIFTPSYVSFETVLAKAGLIFQFYSPVFAASYITREITVDNQVYAYKRIKTAILTNPLGILHANETSVASPERAFLDTLYVNADYQFDNLRPVDWDRVMQILPIYGNQRLAKQVNCLHL